MKNLTKSLFILLSVFTMLNATSTTTQLRVITDSYTSPVLYNTSGTTDIVNLSGEDGFGNEVENFIIKSIPLSNTGKLVMGDGVTAVTVGQHLTIDEVYGLCFHPNTSFVGKALFTYVAVNNNLQGNLGTITIPVIEKRENSKPIVEEINNADEYSALLNSSESTNIACLIGKSIEGVALNEFIIKSLPTLDSGILYYENGKSEISLNSHLTGDEACALTFDPKDGFIGEATFNYVGIENGIESNEALFTIPILRNSNFSVSLGDKDNPEMLNSLGAVNILNLSGKDKDGRAVNHFVIKSLPSPESGILYLADAKNMVKVGQILTVEEANSLKFDPKEEFIGNARFTYVALDDDNVEGSLSTVNLEIVSELGRDGNKPISDDKLNPQMIHTLGPVNILNLSGKDMQGKTVNSFMITALPFDSQGILYLSDGKTPVTVNQVLTIKESNGLKFDPNKSFIGDATFQYVAIDSLGTKGNVAVVRIPVIAEDGCRCEPYRESIPVWNNFSMILMFLLTMSISFFFIRKEIPKN